VLNKLCRCADDTLEYDYFDDYDKIDTEPAGTGTGIFYAAVDVLTIQQVLAGPSHLPLHAQSLFYVHNASACRGRMRSHLSSSYCAGPPSPALVIYKWHA